MGVGFGEGTTLEFDIDKFCKAFKHFPVQVDAALRILQRAGYLIYDTDPDNSPRLRFLLERDQLYMLNDNSPVENEVITALLRLYGGLFADYCFINENMVARKAGLDPQTTYMVLKQLSKRHILHFIPRRKMPAICYAQRREEGSRLVITREVYEDRLESYVQRIDSMIAYATNDTVCRSRQLLRYFGEESTHDCGQCDVCLAHQGKSENSEVMEAANERILALLADHQQHHITELHALGIPKAELDATLSHLIHEERVRAKGAFLFIE